MEFIAHPRPDPTRESFFEYRKIRDLRNRYLELRGYGKAPEKFLIRTDLFLRLFNEDLNLKGGKAMARRTLQFYSSPQARLLPLPVYKDRHTAHYVFPDHYERLAVIWTLRNKFFFPLELIRKLLGEIDADWYPAIMDWDDTPEQLLDAIMMDKAGFEPEDSEVYSAAKGILGNQIPHLLRRDFSEAEAKKAMVKTLDEQYAVIKKWIESGRGIKFLAALMEARRDYPDFRERLDQIDETETEETA